MADEQMMSALDLTEVEAELCRLPEVTAVRLVADSIGRPLEVHVLAHAGKPAKQIVRDVQTLLLTRFNRPIDHRVVSVAYARPGQDASPGRGPAADVDAVEAPAVERIRFGSVNVYVSGSRAQAQVELRWKGVTRMGSASGSATREGAHGLVAAATVAALEEFLEEDWALGLQGIDFVRLGKREVAVVGLALIAHRQEKSLVGCCTVEQDTQQAVALATLAALNRIVGGLQTREPTEYVLRPTSSQEA